MTLTSSRRPLRLLHTSDVHLAGFGGWREGDHHERCLCSLDGIHRLIKDHRIDVLLIAGDLFDHPRQPEEAITRVFRTIETFETETVLLVGNHDVHDHTSLYDRYAGAVTETSVHVLLDHAGATVDLLDGALRVWGKAMDEHSPDYQPLHGTTDDTGEGWFVVMGHGLYAPNPKSGTGRSSLIRPAHIDDTRADYVALGHHHHLLDVSTESVTAWYSGSPSGFGSGQAVVVDLHPEHGVAAMPVEVAPDPSGCALPASPLAEQLG